MYESLRANIHGPIPARVGKHVFQCFQGRENWLFVGSDNGCRVRTDRSSHAVRPTDSVELEDTDHALCDLEAQAYRAVEVVIFIPHVFVG